MLRNTIPWLVLILAFAPSVQGADAPAPLPESLLVHPSALDLAHPRQPGLLQVSGSTADGYTVDLHDQTKFTSADPKVAAVDAQGWVRPLANGATVVRVEVLGRTFSVPVKVALPAAVPPTSFRHEVMPALSLAGCNMGACHGYSLGKNGFKLSLRGADPETDYVQIVRDTLGRRLNFLAPGESLLIAKPRGDVPHEGGVRFAAGDVVDGILTAWIRDGAPQDLADKREVVEVRLFPDRLVLRPGQRHRLQLLARYDDGRIRDVTRLAIFTVNNDRFGTVDEQGFLTAQEAGETAVVARFERTFAAASVLVIRPGPTFTPTPVPPDSLIDRPVVDKLNRLRIVPSPRAGDEEFLRRVYLDLIGLQPRPDEVRAFLADKEPKKRERIVEDLFRRPEFVDHWSLKWGDLLQNSRNTAGPRSVFLFREFLRGAVASNMPLDEFARRLLTARGGGMDDPASVYLASSKDVNDSVERVTQVFCGVRMLCARCHSHPMENWTQADYYGLAGFFNQVRTRPDGRFPRVPNMKVVQLELGTGAAVNPRTGRPQPPRFLGGKDLNLKGTEDRRAQYAQWLTAPENPFFARGLVNRLWSYFFHRGIIEPVDDIRSTNPPINPELLDALTKDFVAHGFDARHLMRRIIGSATYQRTSVPNETNKHDEQNFSRSVPRRVPAEALLDSLVQATGVQENYRGAPAGFRAAQLPDANVTSDVLNLFGKPQRMEACECERDNGSNMLQALHFLNGKTILGRLENAGARPAQLLKGKLSDRELATELYLWSLARHPSAAELRVAEEFLARNGSRRLEAAQDLMWALLNSRDFLLSH